MNRTRKWMNSVDVEVNADTGIAMFDKAPSSSFVGGTRVVASAGTPGKLVADATPCKSVWVGSRVDSDGNEQNTKPVFIGDSAGQNIPIMPTNFEGIEIEIDDASKVNVKVGADGEGVAYRVFV